jgi:hypothetical protein
MVSRSVSLLITGALFGLTACRTQTVLRHASQEHAFRTQYIGRPFYTGIVLRPYESRGTYLIDLTGELADAASGTFRATATVPLGTPITLTALDGAHIMARIEGHARPFRILVRTRMGTLEEVAEELALVLSETPPLQTARPAMRPFITRQEVLRGMSRREVFMSWGQPDKMNSSPGASGWLEEWIYFDRRIHLFLHNGFVTNWQQF